MAKCKCGCDQRLMVWTRHKDGGVTMALRRDGQTERELDFSADAVRDLVESLGGTMPEVEGATND